MRILVRPHARPRQGSGEVAEREPDPRMLRVERGNDDFADVAGRYGITDTGPDDFKDQIFVDDHAVSGLGLKHDHSKIGGSDARLIMGSISPRFSRHSLSRAVSSSPMTMRASEPPPASSSSTRTALVLVCACPRKISPENSRL